MLVASCLVLLLASGAANAQNPDLWVLLEKGSVGTADTMQANLLQTLTRSNLQYGLLRPEDLTAETASERNEPVVVPITDDSSSGYLEQLSALVLNRYSILLAPMLTQPNPASDAVLKHFGFQVAGSQFVMHALPLISNSKAAETILPGGSFIYDVEPQNLSTYGAWGGRYPAALSNGKTFLVSWNWKTPLPSDQLGQWLSDWKEMNPVVPLANSSAIASLQNNNVMNALPVRMPVQSRLPVTPKAIPSKKIIAASDRSSLGTIPVNMPRFSPVSTPARPQNHSAARPVQVSVAGAAAPVEPEIQPQVIMVSPASPSTTAPVTQPEAPPEIQPVGAPPSVLPAAQPSVPSIRPESIPNLSDKNVTPPINPIPSAPAVEEKENYPDTMYEFDGAAPARQPAPDMTIQTTMAEFYNDRMAELAALQDKVVQLQSQGVAGSQRNNRINELLNTAALEKSKFETLWFQQKSEPALQAFEKTRAILNGILLNHVPATQVEGRAIWVDRGSIIRAANEQGLRALIQRITKAGFNVLYFETINAGYPVYPSQLIEQNPQLKGWDPLAIAVDEAHKQGVELHAWVWAFAVGNTRHNTLLGLPDSFRGPILSRPEFGTEALRSRSGYLVPPEQTEYWLSPASPKARGLLTSLYSEIVRKYDVDGLQLDYIRYPFQKPNTLMGFEPFAVNRFYQETGLSLTNPDAYTLQVWTAWKAFQVTSFVRDLHTDLTAIKPNLKISAAVFPMARNGRMTSIQQDWETWLQNGWIDILNPMAYSRTARSMPRLVNYIHTVGQDKTLVYPGISLAKMNPLALLDTIEITRNSGVMGVTLFAVNQFDAKRQSLLSAGPYRLQKTLPPHNNPLQASKLVTQEAQQTINDLLRAGYTDPSMAGLQRIKTDLDQLAQTLQQAGPAPSAGRTQISEGQATQFRDLTRVLSSETEAWAMTAGSDVIQYQAKMIQQMIDKVVRMVNFTAYHLSPEPTLDATPQEERAVVPTL